MNTIRRWPRCLLTGGTLAGALSLAACGSSVPPPDAAPPDRAAAVGVGPLISGSLSWVEGRHVWTDYAYDDRAGTPGAAYPVAEPGLENIVDAAAPRIYPSPATANAADLIQLQLALDDSVFHVRAVLQTLEDVSLPLLGVGLDLDGDPGTGAPAMPGSSWQVQGTALGLERVIIAGANDAQVLAWTGDAWSASAAPAARIDAVHNTIDVTVSRAALGDAASTWRVVGVLGLGDSNHSWVTDGGPIYDLAYVRDDSAADWQSGLQAAILNGEEDAAQAVATIDVADFRGRTELAQPRAGIKQTFLYQSALRLGEGIQQADRKYAGPWQPYSAWFPDSLPPHPPLIVLLHGALQNHLSGQYGPDQPFAPDAVIVTPLGRGEAFGWYAGASEQDVLDVIADAQRRFDVDPDRIVLSGYSLGGVGTFALAQLYPDRWAGAIEIVGAPDLGGIELTGIALPQPYTLENLRNLPFRMGHARADELELIVGAVQPDLAALQLHQLGYDYRYWQFYLRDHLNFPVHVLQCEYEAAIARGRVIDPPRVVYSQEPALRWHESDSGLSLAHDAAYWVSELVVRGEAFAPGDKGTVDITSLALPDRAPLLQAISGTGENLTAGRDVCGDNPDVTSNDVWTVLGQAWDGYEAQPAHNGMVATLTRVASVKLDVTRMGLDARQPIDVDVDSDGDSLLRLAGPWRGSVVVEHVGVATTTLEPRDGVLELAITAGTTTLVVRP